MLFNSLGYLAFLPIIWLLARLNWWNWRKPLLLGASWWFYGIWDWRFLVLFIVSTVVDFSFARVIAKYPPEDPRRKRWLIGSICWGLGVLGFFKYFDFFIVSMSELLTALGMPVNMKVLGIVLPVGISFYTFQTLAYMMDVYRGRIEPVRRFLDFALYLAFFPQLVAGPIHRKAFLFPQISGITTGTADDIKSGLSLILVGFVQKVLLSDNVAQYVDLGFAAPYNVGAVNMALSAILFSAQIYLDFAGYTNIARGSALLFGVNLMINFKRPYFATSPSDFWKRWHISLSTWLRDYLFIPLGGSRGSESMVARNLFLVMVIGGIWHGANWTFVLWGAYHGILLILNRVFGVEEKAERAGFLGRFGLRLFTFVLITIGWIPFRCASLHDTMQFFQALAGPVGVLNASLLAATVAAWLGTLIIDGLSARHDRDDFPRMLPIYVLIPVTLAATIFTILTMLSNMNNERPFIYFQF